MVNGCLLPRENGHVGPRTTGPTDASPPAADRWRLVGNTPGTSSD
jgi:hypothetical protein